MTNTTTTAAALLALPTQVAPSVPFVAIDASWRDRVRSLPTTGMRDEWVTGTVNHNSIVPTTGVVSATAGRIAYGARKQAAPPRGVPR